MSEVNRMCPYSHVQMLGARRKGFGSSSACFFLLQQEVTCGEVTGPGLAYTTRPASHFRATSGGLLLLQA